MKKYVVRSVNYLEHAQEFSFIDKREAITFFRNWWQVCGFVGIEKISNEHWITTEISGALNSIEVFTVTQ